jgi:hypothetical protein
MQTLTSCDKRLNEEFHDTPHILRKREPFSIEVMDLPRKNLMALVAWIFPQGAEMPQNPSLGCFFYNTKVSIGFCHVFIFSA